MPKTIKKRLDLLNDGATIDLERNLVKSSVTIQGINCVGRLIGEYKRSTQPSETTFAITDYSRIFLPRDSEAYRFIIEYEIQIPEENEMTEEQRRWCKKANKKIIELQNCVCWRDNVNEEINLLIQGIKLMGGRVLSEEEFEKKNLRERTQEELAWVPAYISASPLSENKSTIDLENKLIGLLQDWLRLYPGEEE